MSTGQDLSFLGTGWAFPPQFDPHGSVQTVNNEDDIRESLIILLSTVPGERVMHPNFGCGLRKMVFESISESLFTKIKDIVTRAILLYEARISLDQVVVRSDDVVNGLLNIELKYRVRATQSQYNLVYPFYLESAQTEHG